jgi:uncharacterized membrane protein
MLLGLSFAHLLLIFVIAAMWAIPIVAVVVILRSLRGRNRPDPRAILAERLARGEIKVDEFNAAMHALAGPAASRPWGDGGQPPRDGSA